MNILVTGGAGFIGSHICNALLSEGHQVHIIDDLSTGRIQNIPEEATFHEMDIRSSEAAELLAQEKFDVLVHQAAQMDVRKSVDDPMFDAEVNVLGALNLLEAGRRNGLKKVIFASTGGAIYGEPEYAPQDVDHPLRPVSPYGITKLTTEKYLYYYQKQYGIDYVSLRYANVYGPRQNPHGEAGVVAIFTTAMLAGDQPYINGDGEQTRDYVYVDDVVRANLDALEYDGSTIVNVGTGQETDVNELFRTLRDLIDPSIEEKHREGKPGEQRRSVIGYEETSERLGWHPRVQLGEGLQKTVDWFKSKEMPQVT